MANAVFVRKNVVLDLGLEDYKDSTTTHPFRNITLKTNINDYPDSLVLLTEKEIISQISQTLSNSHQTIVGNLEVVDYANLEAQIQNFNNDMEIPLTRLDTANQTENYLYSKSVSKAGDIVTVSFSTAGLRNEQLMVLGSGELTQLTFNNSDDERLKTIEGNTTAIMEVVDDNTEQVINLQANKANKNEVYKKSETYTAVQIDGKLADQTSLISNAGILVSDLTDKVDEFEIKNNQQDTDLTNIKGRLQILEGSPTAQFHEGKLKWNGSVSGNATSATANTTTIPITNLTPATNFNIINDEDITVWIRATSTGLGEFDIPCNFVVGKLVPDLLEAVRSSTSSNLEIVSGILNTNGQVVITRNSGTAIDFTTIKVIRITQNTYINSTSLAKQTELATVQQELSAAETILGQTVLQVTKNEIDITLKQNSKAPSLTTTSKNIVGGINEINSFIKNVPVRNIVTTSPPTTLSEVGSTEELILIDPEFIKSEGLAGKKCVFQFDNNGVAKLLKSKTITLTFDDNTTETIEVF